VEAAITNTVRKGDKALVAANGEFGGRMADIFEKYGAKTARITTDSGVVTAEEIEEALKKNRDVKFVGIVHNETSTAVRNPVEEIAKIAKEREKIILVDAVSSLGGDNLETDKLGIDFVISATQKCLACPPGLSMVSIGEEMWSLMEPRSTYFDLKRVRKFYDEKKEPPFTPAIPIFYALQEGLKMLQEETLEKRIRRHYECSSLLRKGLLDIDLDLVIKEENFASRTVTAVNVPEGMKASEIRKKMLAEGIAIAGGFGVMQDKVLRIGTMGVVTRENVNMTLEALERIL
jgi:aspartate aminotransferase-like enzyme